MTAAIRRPLGKLRPREHEDGGGQTCVEKDEAVGTSHESEGIGEAITAIARR